MGFSLWDVHLSAENSIFTGVYHFTKFKNE